MLLPPLKFVHLEGPDETATGRPTWEWPLRPPGLHLRGGGQTGSSGRSDLHTRREKNEMYNTYTEPGNTKPLPEQTIYFVCSNHRIGNY